MVGFGEIEPNSIPKSSVKDKMSQLSRGLMLPIATLPIAGIVLGIGGAITAHTSANSAGYIIGQIIATPGSLIFTILPLIFAIALAINFTKNAGVAGLSAAIGYLTFVAIQAALVITNTAYSADNPASFSVSFLWYKYNGETGYEQFNGLFANFLGFKTLLTSVFGGIIIGLIVAKLYNKYKDIKLPTIIGFFSGVRFIPVVTIGASLIISLLFAMVWPIIGLGIFKAGVGLSSAPAGINSFFYWFANRALLPFGLHHMISTLVYFTPVGGTLDLSKTAVVWYEGSYWYASTNTVQQPWFEIFGLQESTQYTGEMNIGSFLLKHIGLQINLIPVGTGETINNVHLTYDMMFKGSRFDAGGYAYNPGQYCNGADTIMLLALPAAAMAMLYRAPKGEGRKVALSVTVSAACISSLTGITEPIEFTFLFLAPWLFWGFHAFCTGLACMIATIFTLYTPVGPHVVGTDGLIDLVFWGIIPQINGGGSNWYMVVVISAIFAPIYFIVFSWAIKRFNLATPGRGTTKLFTKSDYLTKGKTTLKPSDDKRVSDIVDALGGKENLINVDACFTRLRLQIKNDKLVNDQALKSLGAVGVLHPTPNSVQVILGTEADVVKNKIIQLLGLE